MTRFLFSKFKFTPAAILFLFVGHVGNASPVLCSSLTQDLAAYAGQTCAIGNVVFTFPTIANGLYNFENDPNNPAVPANDVTVAIVGAGTSSNSQVGFMFTANNSGWIATNPDALGASIDNEADIGISFDVSVTAPLRLNSTTLSVNPLITYQGCSAPLIANCPNYSGGTYIGAGETAMDNNAPPINNGLGGINLTVAGNSSAESEANGGTALSGVNVFPNFSTSVRVDKDLLLSALDNDNSTQVVSFTETFTYTSLPEPGPFLLAGAGLGLLFLLRRRKVVLGLFGVAALIAVSSNSAKASTIACAKVDATEGSDTLLTFEKLPGGVCMIGDVLFTFDSSSLVINGASGANRAPTAAGIIVNVEGLGFQFTTQNPVPRTFGTGKVGFTISFTAESSEEINGLLTSDTVSSNGDGTFGKGPCISVSCTEILEGALDLGSITFPPTAGGGGGISIKPVAPETVLTISTTFIMSSVGRPAAKNNTHLSVFMDGLTEQPAPDPPVVPEPYTLSMLGGGLLAMGLLGRLRRP